MLNRALVNSNCTIPVSRFCLSCLFAAVIRNIQNTFSDYAGKYTARRRSTPEDNYLYDLQEENNHFPKLNGRKISREQLGLFPLLMLYLWLSFLADSAKNDTNNVIVTCTQCKSRLSLRKTSWFERIQSQASSFWLWCAS